MHGTYYIIATVSIILHVRCLRANQIEGKHQYLDLNSKYFGVFYWSEGQSAFDSIYWLKSMVRLMEICMTSLPGAGPAGPASCRRRRVI